MLRAHRVTVVKITCFSSLYIGRPAKKNSMKQPQERLSGYAPRFVGIIIIIKRTSSLSLSRTHKFLRMDLATALYYSRKFIYNPWENGIRRWVTITKATHPLTGNLGTAQVNTPVHLASHKIYSLYLCGQPFGEPLDTSESTGAAVVSWRRIEYADDRLISFKPVPAFENRTTWLCRISVYQRISVYLSLESGVLKCFENHKAN